MPVQEVLLTHLKWLSLGTLSTQLLMNISESCQKLKMAVYITPLVPVLTLIAILLQTHILFSLKTALIHIILVPPESLRSLSSNNRLGFYSTFLNPECSFKSDKHTVKTYQWPRNNEQNTNIGISLAGNQNVFSLTFPVVIVLSLNMFHPV